MTLWSKRETALFAPECVEQVPEPVFHRHSILSSPIFEHNFKASPLVNKSSILITESAEHGATPDHVHILFYVVINRGRWFSGKSPQQRHGARFDHTIKFGLEETPEHHERQTQRHDGVKVLVIVKEVCKGRHGVCPMLLGGSLCDSGFRSRSRLAKLGFVGAG